MNARHPLDHPPLRGLPGVLVRLHEEYGPAHAHLCADCLGPAAVWAYDHDDRDHEMLTLIWRVAFTGFDRLDVVPYTLDLDHWQPRCRDCYAHLEDLPETAHPRRRRAA